MESSWQVGRGPVASGVDGRRIGEFAYALHAEEEDFALIRLDHEIPANPEMAYFGGPTGTNEDIGEGRVILHYYGHGQGVGFIAPGRSAVALDFSSPEHVYATGLSQPGDSGAPVASCDGRAVGILATGGLHGLEDHNPLDFGIIGVVRLGPPLKHAQQRLGLRLDLETAPVGTDHVAGAAAHPRPAGCQ